VSDAAPPSFGAPGVPTPPPGPPRRTPLVTAAGGMLITAGILDALGGIIVVLAGSEALVNGKQLGESARLVGVLLVGLGVLDVLAGLLVLRLSPAGRVLGFVLAGLTIVLALVNLAQGNGRSAVLPLILGGLVIWALVVLEPTFRRASRR
jgi:hypothetical protein